MKKLIFILDNNEHIELQYFCPSKELFSCTNIKIVLKGEKNLILYDNFADGALSALKNLLTAALDCRLKKHSSITKNIGYLWNEEMHDSPGLVYKKLEGRDHWVGLSNLLLSETRPGKDSGSSWLYNDDQCTIILEITPSYPWHFRDPKAGEKYITYEEYMKSYKPLLIRTIPRDKAQEWLTQTQQLSKIIEENEKNAICEPNKRC